MDKKQAAKSKKWMSDEGTCVFGAGILLKHAQALKEEAAGVHAGEEDIEFVHRTRVATRRLRAALPLFQDCVPARKFRVWMANIRKLTRALGEARDTDVQLERLEAFFTALADAQLKPGGLKPGIKRLILRQRQRRQRLAAPLAKAMTRLIESQMIEEMLEYFTDLASRADTVYIYTPFLYQHSFRSISQRLDTLLAYDEIVDQPEKVAELHEMRIHAKWLRYTLENFAPLYSSELKPYLQVVRKIQEILGEIHDCDVWSELLPQFIVEERRRTIDFFGNDRSFKRLVPGIVCFQEDRRRAREALYEEFVACWQQWQSEMVWDSLRTNIQVPFPQPKEVFPPPAQADAEEDAPSPGT